MGSFRVSTRLWARAKISPLAESTSTAPTGTSPNPAAAWASCRASSIGAGTPPDDRALAMARSLPPGRGGVKGASGGREASGAEAAYLC